MKVVAEYQPGEWDSALARIRHSDVLGDIALLRDRAEAFGVSCVEAMAGGVPALGYRGEGGPRSIGKAVAACEEVLHG